MNNQKEAVKLYEPKVIVAGNTLPSHEIEVLKQVTSFLINKITGQIAMLSDDEDYKTKAPLLMGKRRKVMAILELLEGGWDYVGVGRYEEQPVVINDFTLADSDIVMLRNGCDVFQRETRNTVHQKTACRLLNQLARKA